MPTKMPKKLSLGEETLALHLKSMKVPFEREVKIPSPINRKGYVYDFKVDDILIEIQGGTRSGGAHVRPDSYQRDVDKLNAATFGGYQVLWFTTQDVTKGNAYALIIKLRDKKRRS